MWKHNNGCRDEDCISLLEKKLMWKYLWEDVFDGKNKFT